MTKAEAIKYWQVGARRDLKTAQDFLASKHYDWCLFLGHLALEKIIKGLVVKRINKNPLPIHDLIRLCHQAKINLTQEQIIQLKEINRFNLETRYDDYKFKFYKKATRTFSAFWLKIIKEEFFQWFKKLY